MSACSECGSNWCLNGFDGVYELLSKFRTVTTGASTLNNLLIGLYPIPEHVDHVLAKGDVVFHVLNGSNKPVWSHDITQTHSCL